MIALLLSQVLLPLAAAAAAPELPYALPARFEAGLIYVEPVTENGTRLRLFTDTGGGLLLTTASADALGASYQLPADGAPPKGPVGTMPWPEFRSDAWVPPPAGVDRGIAIMVPPPHMDSLRGGMLGAAWFANRCWEFDYPKQTLRLLPDGGLPQVDGPHRVPLGFQKDEAGEQTSAFPRIAVEIDGEPLDLLFDTGATLRVADEALARIGDTLPALRAGSFITQSVANRWRERHPDWPWIENGERGTGMALVQAANVRVAGYDTGPAWFAVRPDANFHEYMSQWMDRRVEGALGGSALQGFRVTVDYRSETATFERPAAGS